MSCTPLFSQVSLNVNAGEDQIICETGSAQLGVSFGAPDPEGCSEPEEPEEFNCDNCTPVLGQNIEVRFTQENCLTDENTNSNLNITVAFGARLIVCRDLMNANINVSFGGELVMLGDINGGNISLSQGGLLTNLGEVSNANINISNTGRVSNFGVINMPWGFSVSQGIMVNNGVLNVQGGDFNIGSEFLLDNNGQVFVNGKVNVNDRIINDGEFTINGNLHLNGQANVVNNCTLNVNGNFTHDNSTFENNGEFDADNLIYQWSPATGLDDPTSRSPIASPSTTTLYTVTVSVPNRGVLGSDDVLVINGDEDCNPSTSIDIHNSISNAVAACGNAPTLFELVITNNGNTDVDEVDLNFSFTPGIELQNVLTPEFTVTEQNSSNTLLHSETPLQPGESITLQYEVLGNCSLINSLNEATDNIEVSASRLGVPVDLGNNNVFSTNLYPIISPVLDYVGDDQIIDYAAVGTSVNREFSFANNGNAPFSGVVEFSDLTTASIEVIQLNVQNLGQATINIVENENGVLLLEVTNLAPGEEFTILEELLVVGCLEDGAGLSDLTMDYGCNEQLCQSLPNMPLANVLRVLGDPRITVNHEFLGNEELVCPGTTGQWRTTLTNIGTEAVSNFTFNYYLFDARQYAFLDGNSLTAIASNNENANLTQVSTSPHPYIDDDPTTTSCVQPNDIRNAIYHVDVLAPGESIVLTYELRECCPPDFVESIGSPSFRRYRFNFEYQNACGDEYEINDVGGMPAHGVNLNQAILQTFSNLLGEDLDEGRAGDTEETVVENMGLNLIGDYYREGVNLLVRIRMENGLEVDNGGIVIQSTAGAISLNPQSVLLGNDAEGTDLGYNGNNSILATFDLDDLFAQLPQCQNGIETVGCREQFRGFFNNSEIRFDLHGICNPPPAPNSSYVVESFIDLEDCENGCQLPVSKLEERVAVQCPGCLTPGWNITDFTMERITLGLTDANNDGIPDNNLTAPREDVDLFRGNVGDVFRTRLVALLDRGDSDRGRTMDQIAEVANFFESSYLQQVIDVGEALDPQGMTQITLFPINGNPQTASFPNGLIIQKTISGNSATFFYNLTQAILSQEFDMATYNYMNIAAIEIQQDFLITSQPATFGDYQYNSETNNLMFLAGRPINAPFGGLIDAGNLEDPEDFEDLDVNADNYFYWCEARGGRFVFHNLNILQSNGQENPEYRTCDPVGNFRTFGGVSSDATPGSIVRNLFDNEYRSYGHVNEMRVPELEGYEFVDAVIQNVITLNNGIEVTTQNQNVTVTAPDAIENGIMVFDIDKYFVDGTFTEGDEYNFTRIYPHYRRTCEEPLLNEETVFTSEGSIVGFPGVTSPYQPANQDNSTSNFFDPKPVFTYEAVNPTITANESEFCWTVRVLNNSDVAVPFTFLRADNPSGLTTITRIVDLETGLEVPLINGVYQLGRLSTRAYHSYNICGTYDCAGGPPLTETIETSMGWDCVGYPESEDDFSCDESSPIVLNLFPTNASIKPNAFVDEIVPPCGEYNTTVELNAIGGGLKDVSLTVEDIPGATYVSSYLDFNNTQVALNSPATLPNGDLLFDVETAVHTAKAQGIQQGDKPRIVFTYETGCGYDLGVFNARVDAENYSCSSVFSEFSGRPNAIEDFVYDDISLNIRAFQISTDRVGVVFSVRNRGNENTDPNDILRFSIPNGFDLVSGGVSVTPDASSTSANLNWTLGVMEPGEETRVLLVLQQDPDELCLYETRLKARVTLEQEYLCKGENCQSDRTIANATYNYSNLTQACCFDDMLSIEVEEAKDWSEYCEGDLVEFTVTVTNLNDDVPINNINLRTSCTDDVLPRYFRRNINWRGRCNLNSRQFDLGRGETKEFRLVVQLLNGADGLTDITVVATNAEGFCEVNLPTVVKTIDVTNHNMDISMNLPNGDGPYCPNEEIPVDVTVTNNSNHRNISSTKIDHIITDEGYFVSNRDDFNDRGQGRYRTSIKNIRPGKSKTRTFYVQFEPDFEGEAELCVNSTESDGSCNEHGDCLTITAQETPELSVDLSFIDGLQEYNIGQEIPIRLTILNNSKTVVAENISLQHILSNEMNVLELGEFTLNGDELNLAIDELNPDESIAYDFTVIFKDEIVSSSIDLCFNGSGSNYCDELNACIEVKSTGIFLCELLDFLPVCMNNQYSYTNKRTYYSGVGLAINKELGIIYVANSGSGDIDKFDYNMNYLGSINTNFLIPLGLDIDNEGNLVVAVNNTREIVKLTPDGVILSTFQMYNSVGEPQHPANVTFDECGNIYTTAEVGPWYDKFDKNGNLIRRFSTFVPGDKITTDHIYGLCVDRLGNVFVTDSPNRKIKKFDKNGVFVTQWDVVSVSTTSELAVDDAGNVYYSNSGEQNIMKFSNDGILLSVFTRPLEPTEYSGWRPRGIDVDENCNVWTSDGAYLNLFSSGINLKESVSFDITESVVNISPNPFTNDYVLSANIQGDYVVNVYDIQGKLVESKSVLEETYRLHMGATLTSGVYIIKINHANGVETLYVTKQ